MEMDMPIRRAGLSPRPFGQCQCAARKQRESLTGANTWKDARALQAKSFPSFGHSVCFFGNKCRRDARDAEVDCKGLRFA
ncbi:hypothetical protein BV898_07336, partial [Hypsibius exemplaris]